MKTKHRAVLIICHLNLETIIEAQQQSIAWKGTVGIGVNFFRKAGYGGRAPSEVQGQSLWSKGILSFRSANEEKICPFFVIL